ITPANTIGTVLVASCSAATTVLVSARMTSGASATNSAAYLRRRSGSAPLQRTSIRTLWPVLQPPSCRPCSAAVRRACSSGSSALRVMSTPPRRIRSRCCARAASGHAIAAPPNNVMNSRRLARNSIRKRFGINGAPVSSTPVRSAHGNSFDHLVGAGQERFGDRQPERLGGRQIDHEIELSRLLDRNVAWLCPAQNLVDVVGGTPEQGRPVCSIGHQTRRFDGLPRAVHRRQPRGQRQ